MRTETDAGTGKGPDDFSLQWSYWTGTDWAVTTGVTVTAKGACNYPVNIFLSFTNVKTGAPITNTKVTLYRNTDLLYTDYNVQYDDGFMVFETEGVGNFSGAVTADGYVTEEFSTIVDYTASITYTIEVKMTPASEQLTISFTWGSSPDDMDLWVVSVKNSNESVMCITNYASVSTPTCQEITMNIDQKTGGLNGPENVTLTNPSVNKDYTYLIGVEDYKWTVSTKDEIINSGAKITIQNDALTQTEEATLSSSVTPSVSK